jgi:hypothetical protein
LYPAVGVDIFHLVESTAAAQLGLDLQETGALTELHPIEQLLEGHHLTLLAHPIGGVMIPVREGGGARGEANEHEGTPAHQSLKRP